LRYTTSHNRSGPPAYDDLGKISQANCGTAWQQTFTPYDRFGNIQKSGSSSFLATYNSKNQIATITGLPNPTYDSNGNPLNDGNHTSTWDADNRPKTVDSINLVYNALEQLSEIGGTTQTLFVPAGTGIARIGLMNGQTFNRAKIPTPGGGAALYDSSLTYAHADWLGSVRFVSTTTQGKSYDRAYAPYGEPYAYAGGTGKMNAEDFSGNREDIATGPTGLYDFIAREFSSSQSRFVSPDPLGESMADPASPQTWNKYSYAGNNPLTIVDSLGFGWEGDDDGGDGGTDSSGTDDSAPQIPGALDPALDAQDRLAQQGLFNPSGYNPSDPTFYSTSTMCPGPGCGRTLADPPSFLPSTMGQILDFVRNWPPTPTTFCTMGICGNPTRFRDFVPSLSLPSCRSLDNMGDAAQAVGFSGTAYGAISVIVVATGGTALPGAATVAAGGALVGIGGKAMNLAAKHHIGCTQ
jgi:RHS repeat-associated protein